MRGRRGGLLALAVLAGVLVVVAWASGRPGLAPLGARLRPRVVEGSTFGSGDTLRLSLQRLGLIHAVPHAYRPLDAPIAYSSKGRRFEEKRGRRGRRYYGLEPLGGAELARALDVPAEWLARPATVASLLVRPEHLEELFARPAARGDRWERPAFFALVDDGELVLATDVGVRLHGGHSRRYREGGSFRLYFRERYGLDRVPADLFPERRAAPPNRLLLRFDGGRTRNGDWRQFTNPLGLDVARRVGLEAPHARPVATFINGRWAGVKSLTEWIHLDFLETRFGHDEFTMVRTKGGANVRGPRRRVGDDAAYHELRAWMRETPRPTVADAAGRVDLDSLVRWFLLVAFCDTQDAYQGPMVREDAPGARWFWIPWDLDQSFGYPRQPGDWRNDSVRPLLKSYDLRTTLLRRLVASDPGFRDRVLAIADDVLTHRLTPEFLQERVATYEAYGKLYGLDHFDATPLYAFMAHRPTRLRELLLQHIGTTVAP